MSKIYVSVPKQIDRSQAKVSNEFIPGSKNLGCTSIASRPTWPAGLVVSMSDYEPRGRGSILGWAPIFQYVFLPFLRFNNELLHATKMK